MTYLACTTTAEELLAWWLGETDRTEDERLDEHLFACTTCAARLDALSALGDAIRRETLRGGFGFVVPAAFAGRMKNAGLTVREYTLAPGGSVNCTIAPGDDFVVTHLHAPLGGVHQLDVLIDDMTIGKLRLTDVPFNPKAGGVTVVPSATLLRSLGISQQRLQLIAVEGPEERVVGDFTFHHTPS
jgi:hypothetical protein